MMTSDGGTKIARDKLFLSFYHRDVIIWLIKKDQENVQSKVRGVFVDVSR
jgi:hypothetical protein